MRKQVIWSVGVLALVATAAVANAAGKESSLSIGFSSGTGEYAEPAKASAFDDPYVSPSGISEIGVNAEYRKNMAEDYAMAIGFDYRFGSIKGEPTTNASPGALDQKITSSSWKIRLGGDRVGKLGDRFSWFMGPGLEYGSGSAKFEDFFPAPDNSVDGEPTNKYGINGRVGGVMMLSPTMGIKGVIGNSFGMASVEDTGGKTTWYYSDWESSWGLQFGFGAK